MIARTEEHSNDGVDAAYADMMARYLGGAIMRAFDNEDVTELYRNAQHDVVWYDTRSRGRIDSGERLDANRCEMFLNAAAASQNATSGPDSPRVQAELPLPMFRGSRLQGFLPPASSGPGPPGRGLKKRNEMVLVVPVVSAVEAAAVGAAPAGVTAPGQAPAGRVAPGAKPPGAPPAAAAAGPATGVVGETIPCEIDCTSRLARSPANANRNGTMRRSFTALGTVLSKRSIRPPISAEPTFSSIR